MMKEIIIPFTWEHVWKSIVTILSCLTITGVIYGIYISHWEPIVFSLLMGGFITLFIAGICSIEYNWDLNPFHKVGYCIRLANDWELKKNEQRSPNEVEHE